MGCACSYSQTTRLAVWRRSTSVPLATVVYAGGVAMVIR